MCQPVRVRWGTGRRLQYRENMALCRYLSREGRRQIPADKLGDPALRAQLVGQRQAPGQMAGSYINGCVRAKNNAHGLR